MPAARFIPDRPEALTAEWLTDALRSGGVINQATVTSFESDPLGEGQGFIGDLARVSIHYDRAEDGAPATVIAKFPTAVPENRALGDMGDYYGREIRSYQDLTDGVPMRRPRLYFSASDPEPRINAIVRRLLMLLPTAVVLRLMGPLSRAGKPRRFVLLLEDLAPALVGDQVAGCTVEECDLALRELAVLHARYWESPRLDELDWTLTLNQDAALIQAMYRRSLGPFRERFERLLSERANEIGEWLDDHGVALMNRLAEPPRTLLHGDYRPDNLFFENGEGTDRLAVIDWQTLSVGCAMYDVAYFLSWSLSPDDVAATGDLLRIYHSTLAEHGVADYDFDRCARDYELAQLFVTHRGIFLVGTLDLSHERAVELVESTLRRSTAQLPAIDLSTALD